MICRACYREIPPGGGFCPRCGARVASGDPATPAVVPPLAGREGTVWSNPWEVRAGRGPLAAFAETLQQALFHPAAFFRGTAPDSGAGAALLYAVVVGTFSIVVAFLWHHALGDQISFDRGALTLNFPGKQAVIGALLTIVPVGVAVFCITSAAVQHLTLAVLGGATGTYRTTLKAVCYSSSALAFMVFPVCGFGVGAIWQAVVQVVGMRELHRTTTARAFWAWFLPIVISTCLAGALFFASVLSLMRIIMEFADGRFAA